MPFAQSGAIRYYRFELFGEFGNLVHGVFTRQGGVSEEPWDSLNMATSVGDTRENVLENRRRILDALGLAGWGFFDVWQVHGTTVLPTQVSRPLNQPHQKADCVLTDQNGVALLMLFADCVPVVLFDPLKQAVGMAHAGWQGSVNRVAAKAVEQMASVYGSRPENLMAGIGPSICAEHYEVGEEVLHRVDAAFGAGSSLVKDRVNGKGKLDLWETNRQVLLESGLLPDHIQVCGFCTAEKPDDWYSHRGEKGKTGRFGAVIGVKK